MQLISHLKQILHSTVKVPDDILVINAKNLTSKINMTLEDMNTPITENHATAQGEPQPSGSSDDQNALALVLKAQEQVLTKIESQRIQHINISRDEYLHFINFWDDQLPISKFNYKVNKSTKIATMNITRNNQPLNYKIFKEFKLKILGFAKWLELHKIASRKQGVANDQLLKNLKAKFKWVATIAEKLNIPPPPQLTDFKLLPTEQKIKRINKVLK
ncbi:hypothetical protein Tco_1319269 [Tanacetum coccineum]